MEEEVCLALLTLALDRKPSTLGKWTSRDMDEVPESFLTEEYLGSQGTQTKA